MNVHVFQHVPFEGLGAIAPWLHKANAKVTVTRFFESSQPPASVDSADWLIVMGGPMSVHDGAQFPWLSAEKKAIAKAIQRGATVLGICLGAQLVAEALGGKVTRNQNREIGWWPVTRVNGAAEHPIGSCFPDTGEFFHWHGETFSLPKGSTHLLRSAGCENQAFVWNDRVVGLQFHLETTEEGAYELIVAARGDLADGRYVQTDLEILSAKLHFARAHAVLDRVLSTLAPKPASPTA